MKMKYVQLTIFFILFLIQKDAYSQVEFTIAEKDLAKYCDFFINAEKSEHRIFAHSKFKHDFLDLLKYENSFSYPFDSLMGVSILVSPDSSLRVISWQLMITDNRFEYYGYIQKKNGSIFELIDNKEFFSDLEYEVFTNNDWYGQIYYHIHQYDDRNIKKYILFGYKRLGKDDKIKIASPIHFDNNVAYFGKDIFEDTLSSGGLKNRIVHKTAISAASSLTYNDSKEMIIYDHTVLLMVSSRFSNKVKPSYVPDGSYHGYKWNGKYWEFVNKVFSNIYNEVPRPNPILNKGKLFNK